MSVRTFKVKPQGGDVSAIELPFDPREVFGKARAPVIVTINGYVYRSTVAAMGGPPFVPLSASRREAAGLKAGAGFTVRVELDTEKRVVTPPADLQRALKASAHAWERWSEMSFTHQREYVEAIEEAKRPETRVRRILKTVEAVGARPPRKKPAAR